MDTGGHGCTYRTPGNLAVCTVPVMVVVKAAVVDHGRDVRVFVLVHVEAGGERGYYFQYGCTTLIHRELQ